MQFWILIWDLNGQNIFDNIYNWVDIILDNTYGMV